MGLCKCPQRNVTNQFCFEHRVNVCEHCMVKSHRRCIIQNYIQWLQDSEFEPNCHSCLLPLEDNECVRLSCYHLLHENCLDQHLADVLTVDSDEQDDKSGDKEIDWSAFMTLQCTQCSTPVVPAELSVSPVVSDLRTYLTSWIKRHCVGPNVGNFLTKLNRSGHVIQPNIDSGRPQPDGQDDPSIVASFHDGMENDTSRRTSYEFRPSDKSLTSIYDRKNGDLQNDDGNISVDVESEEDRLKTPRLSLNTPLFGQSHRPAFAVNLRKCIQAWIRNILPLPAQTMVWPWFLCRRVLTVLLVVFIVFTFFEFLIKPGQEEAGEKSM